MNRLEMFLLWLAFMTFVLGTSYLIIEIIDDLKPKIKAVQPRIEVYEKVKGKYKRIGTCKKVGGRYDRVC